MEEDTRRKTLLRCIPSFLRRSPPAMVLALTWFGAAALLMTTSFWWGLAMAALPLFLLALAGAGPLAKLNRRVLVIAAAGALVLAALSGGFAQARQAAQPLPVSAISAAAQTMTFTTKAAITATATPAQTLLASPVEGVGFVASRQGEVYHLPDCASAKRIKPENLVAYPSFEEAEAAGLRPCKKCKPNEGSLRSRQPNNTQPSGGS